MAMVDVVDSRSRSELMAGRPAGRSFLGSDPRRRMEVVFPDPAVVPATTWMEWN